MLMHGGLSGIDGQLMRPSGPSAGLRFVKTKMNMNPYGQEHGNQMNRRGKKEIPKATPAAMTLEVPDGMTVISRSNS